MIESVFAHSPNKKKKVSLRSLFFFSDISVFWCLVRFLFYFFIFDEFVFGEIRSSVY